MINRKNIFKFLFLLAFLGLVTAIYATVIYEDDNIIITDGALIKTWIKPVFYESHSVWMPQSAADANGYLDQTDWQAFDAKSIGPSSSTDNALARFDGTGGNTLQNSLAILNDAGLLALPALTTSETLEGATITEGGQAVWNATETDILDSGHYIAASIDYEHLADDIISGAAAVGAFESGDTFLVLEAGVGLREVDYDDLPGAGGGNAWSDAVDSDILPTGNDNTYDLGSVAASFKDGYFQGTLDAGSVTDGTATLTGGALTGLTTALTVAQGGTGAMSLNDGFVLLGSNTAAITPLDVTIDGAIIIGDGTTDPVTLDVGSSTAITILGTVATGTWQATNIADAYVPDNITIDLATLATTVTVSDDESTDDDQEIVFTTDNTNLESDGDFHYSPDTGTLTATEFVGGGAGLTGVGSGVTTGATVPGAPSTADLFLHTPTGRKILMEYDGSNWNNIISYGTMTVYVDATDGTDDVDGGTGVDSDAFATVQYAVDTIPPIFGGSVVINVNNETYAEDVTIRGKKPGGNYTITLQGVLASQESGTWSANGAQGTGATRGAGQSTGSFAGDSYANMLVLEGGDSVYRVIDVHSDDVLTVVGTFDSQPQSGETWEVFDWGTTIQSLTIEAEQKAIIVNDIEFTKANYALYLPAHGEATCNRIKTTPTGGTGIRLEAFSKIVINNSYHTATANHAIQGLGYGFIKLQACKINGLGNAVTGIKAQGVTYTRLIANVIDDCDGNVGAVETANNSVGQWWATAAQGYNRVRNCGTYGLRAKAGGMQTSTSNNVYSGNGTNESADGASFGYID